MVLALSWSLLRGKFLFFQERVNKQWFMVRGIITSSLWFNNPIPVSEVTSETWKWAKEITECHFKGVAGIYLVGPMGFIWSHGCRHLQLTCKFTTLWVAVSCRKLMATKITPDHARICKYILSGRNSALEKGTLKYYIWLPCRILTSITILSKFV